MVSRQERLFDTEISEGALDVSMAFRDSLTQSLRKTNESRYGVAAKISELTNRNISKDMLDKYTSNNPDYGLRAEDLPAFCMATKSIEPFRVLLHALDHEVISPEEGQLVRLAKLTQQRRELDAEIARLEIAAGIKR
jgi:hypothetical protein